MTDTIDIQFDRETQKRIERMVKKIDAVESKQPVDREAQAALYDELEDKFSRMEQAVVTRQLDRLAEQRYQPVEPEDGWYVPPKPEPVAPVKIEVAHTPRRTRIKVSTGEVDLLAEAILATLRDRDALTKGEILKAIGGETPKPVAWNKAIASLIESKKIQTIGKKRGTRYALYGKKVTVKKLTPQAPEVISVKAAVIGILKSAGSPLSRSDVFQVTGPIQQEIWLMAMRELEAEGKVIKTGNKRGTKYEAK